MAASLEGYACSDLFTVTITNLVRRNLGMELPRRGGVSDRRASAAAGQLPAASEAAGALAADGGAAGVAATGAAEANGAGTAGAMTAAGAGAAVAGLTAVEVGGLGRGGRWGVGWRGPPCRQLW